MNKKSGSSKASVGKLVKNIRRKTWQTYSADEKIRIVLARMRGEKSGSAPCRWEGIAFSRNLATDMRRLLTPHLQKIVGYESRPKWVRWPSIVHRSFHVGATLDLVTSLRPAPL